MSAIHAILKKYWGHVSFRPLQEEIIQSILSGKDTLALLPTGGGKSICFQVPALSLDGICIVVSPLIALMKDQVDNLERRGIKACAIYSGMKASEIDIALDNCVYGKIKFLYISPERLGTELFQVRVQKMKVSFLAIDEAHCISQWGYDFRPAYLKIAQIRELLPKVNVLALTATATTEVVKDIQVQLAFQSENVFQVSFSRPNLSYVVLYEEDKWNRLLKIMRGIAGSGIVYARSRKKTREISEFLNQHGIAADYYHAGLEPKQRDLKQQSWMENKCRVMVCTNAFGMGIDKPDVRFVVHLELTESLEAYFQEAGRAGRDGQKAYAILLFQQVDSNESEYRLKLSFPEIAEIKQVYQAIANYYRLAIGSGYEQSYDFDLAAFCDQYNFKANNVVNCIKFMERENLIFLGDQANNHSKIKLLLNKTDLYQFQIQQAKYDTLLKTILRSYSGAFDDYIIIQETELAKRAELSKEKVKEYLSHLTKLNVLHYLPQTFLPQLTFLSERVDVRKMTIAPEILQEREAQARKKLAAVIHYAEHKTTCRSQLLLAYFGELNSAACGTCDVCLNRNKAKNLSTAELSQLSDSIERLLKVEAMSIEKLVAKLHPAKEKDSLSALQQLQDMGKVKTMENQLFWSS